MGLATHVCGALTRFASCRQRWRPQIQSSRRIHCQAYCPTARHPTRPRYANRASGAMVLPQDGCHVVLRFPIRWNPPNFVHYPRSGIVRSQRFLYVAVVPIEQQSQIPHAAVDIVAIVPGIHAQVSCGRRHQLHHPDCPLGTSRSIPIPAFDARHGIGQLRVYTVLLRSPRHLYPYSMLGNYWCCTPTHHGARRRGARQLPKTGCRYHDDTHDTT